MKKKIFLSLICMVALLTLVVGCGNSNSDDWNDYSFYISDTKIELPLSFSDFNNLVTKNSKYKLSNENDFNNNNNSSGGISDAQLAPNESKEFSYLYQYGSSIMEQYYLYFTLKNESEERKANKDCTVVAVRVGNYMDAITSFDSNIKFTSKKINTGLAMTENDLKDKFGEYDEIGTNNTYRYDKFSKGIYTNYSLSVSLKDDVIQQISLSWIDKTED